MFTEKWGSVILGEKLKILNFYDFFEKVTILIKLSNIGTSHSSSLILFVYLSQYSQLAFPKLNLQNYK